MASLQDTAKLENTPKCLQLYKSFPGLKIFKILVLRSEETLENLPKKLFQLPTQLSMLEHAQETLKDRISKHVYKDLNSDPELTDLMNSIDKSIKNLKKKMQDLNIVKVFDPLVQETLYSFENCSVLEEGLLLLDIDKTVS